MYATTSYSRPSDLLAHFDELQRQFEQVFSNRPWPSSIRSVGSGTFPAVNVGTTSEAIEIYAFAPGIDLNALDVTVDKGLLTISGQRETATPRQSDTLTVYARERSSGGFRRVVNLPDDADPERVSATYRNGVLRVSVQKREASKPRRIEIKEAQ